VRLGQVYLDVRGRRLHLLNAAARQLHADGVPFLGNEPGLRDLFTPGGTPARPDALPLAIAAREGRPAEADFLLRRAGEPAWQLSWCATPFKDASGRVASVLATVCCTPPPPDWQTLAGLAHDLRTPLQTLSVLLNVVDGQPADGRGEALQLLRATAGRVLDVASDLLDWCRLPAQGGRRVEWAWLPVEPLLSQLLRELESPARQKALGLGASLGEVQGWQIYSDRVRLGRLLMNLLSNAVRYTPPGGRVTLSAAWREEGGERLLVLGVADTGAGIGAEEQESIFQPFERGRTGMEGDSSGSGLGLAIVDQLAAELGLRREVHSEYGRGSVFRALVPLRLLRFAPPPAPHPPAAG
jgi:hypothetical protein